MDRVLTLLVFGLVFLFGGLAVDRLPPIDYRVPIPIIGPHIRFDSLKAERDKARAALVTQAARVKPREAAASAITAEVAKTLQTETVRVRTVTQTILEKVPIYVSAESDARCVVPAGFVSLHDAAALGSPILPDSARGLVDDPSGVPLSAVADTVVANYGAGNLLRAEVLAWRSWYAQQKAAWDRR
jgi:hypothetical protein